MDKNEKIEKARKTFNKYKYRRKRVNSEVHSSISEDDSKSLRSQNTSTANSPLISPRSLSKQNLKQIVTKDENPGKNTEQQTIQLLIEEKSDLITERDKLLYQIEQLKFEKKNQDEKLNEYLETIKKNEEREIELNKLNEQINEEKKELDSYIVQNKELLDKINYQASIITDLTNENKSLSSKAEIERASSSENLIKLADDLEDKSKKLEDAMLEISTNLNTINQWEDKYTKLDQQNQELKEKIKSLEEKDYNESINSSLFIQSLLEYIRQIKNDNEILKPILTNIYDVNTLNDTLELVKQLISIIQNLEIKIENNESQINQNQTDLEEQKKDQEELQFLKSKLEQKEKEMEKMEKILFDLNEKCESLEELLAEERNVRAEKEEIIEEQTETIEEMTEEAQQINSLRINIFKFLKLMEDLAEYLVNTVLKDDNSFDHSKILDPFGNIQKNDNIGKLNQVIPEMGNSFNVILPSLKEYMEIKKIEKINSNSKISLTGSSVTSTNNNNNNNNNSSNNEKSEFGSSRSSSISKKNSMNDIKPFEVSNKPEFKPEENITNNSMKEKDSNENEDLEKLKEANILLRNKLADQQLVRDKLLEEIESVKQEAVQKTNELNDNYEKAMEDIKKEKFKNNEYVTHMATMQEELTRLMNLNDNLNKRQEQLEIDLEKMITDNLSMKNNTKTLKADKQVLLSKLSHEVHVNDLLSNEVDSLPDYILLYHKERKMLMNQNKKLIEKIELLKEGKNVSLNDLDELIANAKETSNNFVKFNSNENINENINNTDQLSIVNNSEVSVPEEEIEKIYKSNDIFDNMDNVINDNVLDFTPCRFCSSNIITL